MDEAFEIGWEVAKGIFDRFKRPESPPPENQEKPDSPVKEHFGGFPTGGKVAAFGTKPGNVMRSRFDRVNSQRMDRLRGEQGDADDPNDARAGGAAAIGGERDKSDPGWRTREMMEQMGG